MTVTRRAYSSLTIKAVDEEKRIIRGIATTPIRVGIGVVTLAGWIVGIYTWMTGRPPP